jgi:dynein heavy chain
LTVGEVPNIFSVKEGYPVIRDKCKREYVRARDLPKDARVLDEDILDFFFTRV